MNRPKVVLRTVASLDGKVLSVPCAGEEWLKFTHKPDVILLDESEFGGDDWEPPPLPPVDGDPQPLYQDFLPDKVVHRPEHQGWYTVVDSRGRQRWAFKEDRGWHLLVLVAHHTSPEYLTYLRRENIPYLVAGEENLDFRLAIEKLGSLLNVKCVMSTAGEELGGALWFAGVVDDVNIEFSSTIEGDRKTPLLFDVSETDPSENPLRLKLISVQVQAEGRVWHRYQAVPKDRHLDVVATVSAEDFSRTAYCGIRCWEECPVQAYPTRCEGCKSAGERLIPSCRGCSIRKCASERQVVTCAHCGEYLSCDDPAWESYPELRTHLDQIRSSLEVQAKSETP